MSSPCLCLTPMGGSGAGAGGCDAGQVARLRGGVKRATLSGTDGDDDDEEEEDDELDGGAGVLSTVTGIFSNVRKPLGGSRTPPTARIPCSGGHFLS